MSNFVVSSGLPDDMIWSNDVLVSWCIYAYLGLNDLSVDECGCLEIWIFMEDTPI